MKRRGFIFLDAFGLIGASTVMLLVGVAAVQVTGGSSEAKLVRCLTNLKATSTGMGAYKAANNDRTPVIRSAPSTTAGVNAAPTAETATDDEYGSAGVQSAWTVLGDQGMQNVWLMIQSGDLKESVFKCPGDKDWEVRDSELKFGWTSSYQFSYSIQWPYAKDAAGNRNPAPFSADIRGDVAVLGDRNPGAPAEGEEFVPSNHPLDGTNVLAGDTPQTIRDSSVIFSGEDDIYTAQATVGDWDEDPIYGGMPKNKTDTSLTLSPRDDDEAEADVDAPAADG